MQGSSRKTGSVWIMSHHENGLPELFVQDGQQGKHFIGRRCIEISVVGHFDRKSPTTEISCRFVSQNQIGIGGQGRLLKLPFGEEGSSPSVAGKGDCPDGRCTERHYDGEPLPVTTAPPLGGIACLFTSGTHGDGNLVPLVVAS